MESCVTANLNDEALGFILNSSQPDPTRMRPIAVFGVVIVALALLGPYLFLGPTPFNFYRRDPGARPSVFLYGVLSASGFYAVTGLGIILRARWGYVLFKGFLYVLLLSFPIGTAISWVTLSYMKKHQIRQYFGFQARKVA